MGNKSPHPFWLFVILAGLVAVLSAGLATAGVTAQNPATGDAETVLTRMTKKYHAEERSEAEAARAAEAGDGEHAETFTAQTLTVPSRRETTALWAAVGSSPWAWPSTSPLSFIPGPQFPGEDGSPLTSVLISSVAVPIGLLFFVCDIAYGIVAGTIDKASDVPPMMASAVTQVAPLIVLFFAAAQFIAWFDWSNMGTVLAIKTAGVLGSTTR